MFRRLGKFFFKGTRWEPITFEIYMILLDCNEYKKLPWRPYTVDPQGSLDSFKIFLPARHRSPSHSEKIEGVYESEILQVLKQEVTANTSFWEVGGGWGYFSLALASIAKKVTIFESDPSRTKKIRRSINANGYSNIEIVCSKIGKFDSLDNYECPNLILMDIEGWEFAALKSAPYLLDEGPTLIVELHNTEDLYMDEPDAKPKHTVSLLEKYGYRITKLSQRKKGNYHIIAKN